MDKIIINGLRIFAYHGVNAEEKQKGQIFEIDCVIYMELINACQSDCIDDTVSYAKIIKTLRRAMTERSFDLLEAAAQYCIDCLLKEYESIEQVELTLKKPRAPIAADFDCVAVQLFRAR